MAFRNDRPQDTALEAVQKMEPSMTGGLGNGGKTTLRYQGVDIGAYMDYGAIYKLVQDALGKMPPGQLPGNAEQMAFTIVIHPADGEGSAWAMDHNPYKTWGWMVVLPILLQSGLLGLFATHGPRWIG